MRSMPSPAEPGTSVSGIQGKRDAASFILIAGAYQGAWCWERLVPLLAAAGHRVLTPDLLGMGEDPTPLADVTPAAWADQIAVMVELEAHPVILVGHSRAGIVLSEVAERVPDRIAMLVYLAAYLYTSGESIFGSGPLLPEGSAELRDDTVVVKTEYVRPLFFGDAPEGWSALASGKMSAEPTASFAAPVTVTPARFGRVKRAYIETQRDRVIPIGAQRAMQAALPCDPVFTLDSDHSPFFSQPDDLAGCLLSLAARLNRS